MILGFSAPGPAELLVILAMGFVMYGVPCCIAAYFLSKAKLRSPSTWMTICLFLPFIGLVLLAILPKGTSGTDDGETRCRKCGYILRGIPEPRCSECGEII